MAAKGAKPSAACLHNISNLYDNVSLPKWGQDFAHTLIVYDPAWQGGAQNFQTALRKWPKQVDHDLANAGVKTTLPKDLTGLQARMYRKDNVFARLNPPPVEHEKVQCPYFMASERLRRVESSPGLGSRRRYRDTSTPDVGGSQGASGSSAHPGLSAAQLLLLSPTQVGALNEEARRKNGAPAGNLVLRRPFRRGLVSPIRTAFGGFAKPTPYDMINNGWDEQ